MIKIIKNFIFVCMGLFFLTMVACGNESEEESAANTSISNYPEREIHGTIMWGEGGATDIIARTLGPYAEEELDTSLVLENREGATGVIATEYVASQPANGYELLIGAENPNLYQVLGLSDRSYMSDFIPVNIIGQGYAAVVVREDSRFKNINSLIDYAKAHPGEVNMGTTGTGGIAHVVASMFKSEIKTEFNQIPYDGEGPASTALLGEEVEVSVINASVAQEYVKSGDFRVLSIIHDEKIDALPEAPPITDAYPELEQFLPWGPYQGVFVDKDTPEEIVEKLSSDFKQAQENEEFKEQLTNLGFEPLNLSDEEAIEYVQNNQSTSTWMLHRAGETEESPQEFDIAKPE